MLNSSGWSAVVYMPAEDTLMTRDGAPRFKACYAHTCSVSNHMALPWPPRLLRTGSSRPVSKYVPPAIVAKASSSMSDVTRRSTGSTPALLINPCCGLRGK